MDLQVNEQVKDLADKFNFGFELVNRYCFHYGYSRTVELLKALSVPPKTLAIRTNTLQTTPEKLEEALLEKEITAKQHSKIKEAIMIKINGPFELQEREKQVVVFKSVVNKALIGGNISASSVKKHEDLKIGEEVSIVDDKGTLVANGIAMMNSSEIHVQKRRVAIKTTNSKYKMPNFPNLKEYLRGHFIEQPLPSILVGSQIELKPQDRVMDMIVGEGEILTHIWQRNSKVKSRIIAVDNSATKLDQLQQNIKRLRMRQAPVEAIKINVRRIPKKFSKDETFNVIILNPPSSKTGLRPKIQDNTSEEKIVQAARLQKRFLVQAARLIKPNGTIMYCTDSIDPAENEKLIEFAIDSLKLSIVEQKIFLGEKCSASFNGAEKLQYFYPDKHDTIGYFIAKLIK